jgi:hypothetical protein
MNFLLKAGAAGTNTAIAGTKAPRTAIRRSNGEIE